MQTRGSCLLLHGFTGTPHEVEQLKLALEKQGFDCVAPTLPGHGTAPADLDETTAADWLKFVAKAFKEMPKTHPRIVIGQSMGGLLGTILTAKNASKVDGLVLLSPAFALRSFGELGVVLSRLGIYHFVKSRPKAGGSDILDPRARAANPSYNEIRIKGLRELGSIRDEATRALSEVRCPVYVGLGAQDHTVNSTQVEKIITKRIGASSMQIEYFLQSAHVLPLDYDRDVVISKVVAFCESIHESHHPAS